MVSSPTQTKPLLGRKSPLAKLQLVLIAGVVALSGGYLVSKTLAATASLSFVPSTTSVNIGDMVTVAIRENSSTDTVNAVQANVAFDATKLQYIGVSETGSAFGVVAATIPGTGTLELARGVSGGSPAVSGDQLVTTVTFKALAAGSVPLTFGNGSAVVRSTDAVDILAVKNTTTLTLADLAAPSVPTNLAAPTKTITSIGLTWTASTDNVAVSGYRVFRNGVQVGTTAFTTYTDNALTPNTAYSYRVAAVDAAGNVSAQAPVVTASTLPDTQAPTAPGAPTSSAQTMTSITLNWTASTDNVGVTGYRVYRNSAQVSAPTGLTYTDTGLAVNTQYTYTVAAVDAAGNISALSTAAPFRTLADTVAPSVPTNLQSAVTNFNVALTWTASTDNVATTVYAVYRDGVQFATTASTNYTVTNAPTGTHTYSVSAGDAAGNFSAQSTAVSVQLYIRGDINRDTKVDVFDLSTLISNWGRTGISTSDVNGDSNVNIFDLSILLSNWTG